MSGTKPVQFGRNKALAEGIKYLALTCICVWAFSIRLFSVIKYESVIHEFDPYFNYRVTQFLSEKGFYSLWNWFDDRTWYPLGRVIGGTVYPGLIFTAGTMWNILQWLNLPIHVQEVCVFTAPIFSALCALATFGFVKEVRGDKAGLLAAAFVAAVPSYISRSVGGSYDNEGVAIFALVNVFYTFIKTVNTGSLTWAMANVMAYFYMVLSWGGYSFVINIIPIYCLAAIFVGRFNMRMYVAFAPLVVMGTLLACNIPVVGFNAVLMSEHFGAFLACFVMHVVLAKRFVASMLSERHFRKVVAAIVTLALAAGAALLALVIGYVLRSPTLGWTGRSLSLLDPTYASKYIPIIASVSEHQPPNWSSYVMDLHLLVLAAPAGLIACYRRMSDASLFLALYGVFAVYFSGVMVRLMLVLAPAACCLAAVGLSELLTTLAGSLKLSLHGMSSSNPLEASEGEAAATPKGGKKRSSTFYAVPTGVVVCLLSLLAALLAFYVVHCVHASADMYSSPSIVLLSGKPDGGYHVFDDFREAYAWLRHNTAPDAKVASWWDYGYQTTAMANRTVVVDNNTWNNTHIATVGRAMSSNEAKAWQIYRYLDVEYVFVVFGGLIGYPSDDINKFLWMVRIGGGVYPEIREADYLAGGSDYRVDAQGTKTMLNSLMYKLSYHDFAEESQRSFGRRGLDRVRGNVIGRLNVKLNYFEEVFTSQHWMMRIYRVRDKPLRDPLKSPRGGKPTKSRAPS